MNNAIQNTLDTMETVSHVNSTIQHFAPENTLLHQEQGNWQGRKIDYKRDWSEYVFITAIFVGIFLAVAGAAMLSMGINQGYSPLILGVALAGTSGIGLQRVRAFKPLKQMGELLHDQEGLVVKQNMQISSLQKENQEFELSNKKYIQLLQEQTEVIEEAKKQLAVLTTTNQQLSSTSTALKEQVKELSQSLYAAEVLAQELKSEALIFQEQNNKLQGQIEQLSQQLHNLHSKIATMHEENSKLSATGQQLAMQVETFGHLLQDARQESDARAKKIEAIEEELGIAQAEAATLAETMRTLLDQSVGRLTNQISKFDASASHLNQYVEKLGLIEKQIESNSALQHSDLQIILKEISTQVQLWQNLQDKVIEERKSLHTALSKQIGTLQDISEEIEKDRVDIHNTLDKLDGKIDKLEEVAEAISQHSSPHHSCHTTPPHSSQSSPELGRNAKKFSSEVYANSKLTTVLSDEMAHKALRSESIPSSPVKPRHRRHRSESGLHKEQDLALHAERIDEEK